MSELPDFRVHVKPSITITRPMPSVTPRGLNSDKHQETTRTIRIEPKQLDAIDTASELLGMSRSSFIRWCAYRAALDIIEQHNEFVRKFGS